MQLITAAWDDIYIKDGRSCLLVRKGRSPVEVQTNSTYKEKSPLMIFVQSEMSHSILPDDIRVTATITNHQAIFISLKLKAAQC